MKRAINIEGLKQNARELAEALDTLFNDFENNNIDYPSCKYSVLLLNPDELKPDLEAEKHKFISVNEGELFVALVQDDGRVVDLSIQR